MRAPDQLLHTRTRVRDRYALLPLEGFPTSRISSWNDAEIRILCAPVIGAHFAQYKIELQTRGGTKQPADGRIETFVYLMSGEAKFTIDGKPSAVTTGGYMFVPHASGFAIEATAPSTLLVLRKAHEPALDVPPAEALVGNSNQIKPEAFMGNEHARLQLMIPDDLQYDLAMNIFTFDPGHRLPYVETHVMEHGAYILEGMGVYYLDGEWMEVQAGDFIWMGPYCPQSFYATGASPAKYIYYKNVNREISL